MSRIRADQITNISASGPPTATNGLVVNNGLNVSGVSTFTGAIGIGTAGTIYSSSGATEAVFNVSAVGDFGLAANTFGKKIRVVAQDDVIISSTQGSVLTRSQQGAKLIDSDSVLGDVSLSYVTSSGSNGSQERLVTTNAGVTVFGSCSATSFIGDGSSLSGVESGIANFVATGTISNGATVVINTDGTVSVVAATTSGPSIGSEVVFSSGSTNSISSAYDSVNDKVVIVYSDFYNFQYGTAIVGTVSGTSITFGSPVVFNAGATSYISAVYVPTKDKVVITYADDSDASDGTSIVGTITGTSITFGKEVGWNGGFAASFISSVYDSTSDKVVIAFRGNNNYGVAIVATIDGGGGISFGTDVTFNSGSTRYISTVCDSANGRVVIAYQDRDNSDYGTAIVGTVSGTSISFGSEETFNAGGTTYTTIAYDSTSDKVVIAYRDDGNNSYGTAIVGTVSGTSISFGSEVVFNAGTIDYNSAVYDSVNNKVVIAYRDIGNSSHGYTIVGTVSGTSISFGSEVAFNAASTEYTTSIYVPTSGKVLISYRDDGNSNKGTSVLFSTVTKTTNLTSENYIGIAAEAISGGATGKITIVGGVNAGQSSLAVGKKYYVQIDGSLATTPTDLNVVAGTSISSTKILVR